MKAILLYQILLYLSIHILYIGFW